MAQEVARHSSKRLVDSDEIAEASFHVRLPLSQRRYLWPFIFMYIGWISLVIWSMMEGKDPNGILSIYSFQPVHEFNELWLVPLALLILAHFITFMSGFWSVKADTWLSCRQVESVKDAKVICVVPVEHRGKAALCPIIAKDGGKCFFFSFQQVIYHYDEDRKTFAPPTYPDQLPYIEYLNAKGHTASSLRLALDVFGVNKFDLPVPSFLELFKEHAVAPFFVFQIGCVALWCLDEYWYYSLFTLFMLFVFESSVVQQRLKNLSEFRSMSLPILTVWTRREGKWKAVKSDELVPGDLVFLKDLVSQEDAKENHASTNSPSHSTDIQKTNEKVFDEEGLVVPCDLVLLEGSCIVNEAMISGESTPLLKESITGAHPHSDLASLSLDISAADKTHVVFGGTKVLQMISQPNKNVEFSVSKPEGMATGCLAFVARTGFGTMQGQLVRTMIFSSEQMTANNRESFAFILFLLIFAIAAAVYVMYHGWYEVGRSRYKLLLEGALIITAVVPPELPMELSLAVNTSLIALSKFAIFCMEPFRIPLAGKLDICCFDKTGTLTGENLEVEGVVTTEDGLVEGKSDNVLPMVKMIMASCQALFPVGISKHLAGDPMEKASVEFSGWQVISSDTITNANANQTIKIISRFAFSSALKRMSCIVEKKSSGTSAAGIEHFVVSKGAPEIFRGLLKTVPVWYDQVFDRLARSGARIIALGYSPLGKGATASNNKHALTQLTREQVEKDLIFSGFLVFRCPLKLDSKKVLRNLLNSSHRVIMITGDSPLTALHTARQLTMFSKESTVLLCNDELDITIERTETSNDTKLETGSLTHQNGSKKIIWDEAMEMCKKHKYTTTKVEWCITGNAIDGIFAKDPEALTWLLPRLTVIARASPAQKEFVLTELKRLGYFTLMCGDGTNDVGALKQAHIGVALLDGKPEDLAKIQEQAQKIQRKKRQAELEASRVKWQAKIDAMANQDRQLSTNQQAALQQRLEAISLAAGDMDEPPLVKLGDASVAAPFTSKISTIEAVANIIRQGRCTLVTMIQMYKILALNSLISAYSLSVLHLEGIRYGDFQVTITGMLLAGCFLFLSRSKPIEKLSKSRPQANIFNWYLMTSVLGQFFLHVAVLIYILSATVKYTFPIDRAAVAAAAAASSTLTGASDSAAGGGSGTTGTEFSPSLVNTAVYLVSLLMQVSTFVVNYQGRPFRESLMENKPLRNSLAIVAGIAVVAATEMNAEFNTWLQLVPMPNAVNYYLYMITNIDVMVFWLVISFARGCAVLWR